MDSLLNDTCTLRYIVENLFKGKLSDFVLNFKRYFQIAWRELTGEIYHVVSVYSLQLQLKQYHNRRL